MGEIPVYRPEGFNADAAKKSLEDLQKKNAERREASEGAPVPPPAEKPEL